MGSSKYKQPKIKIIECEQIEEEKTTTVNMTLSIEFENIKIATTVKKNTSKRFIPPTIVEIAEYCKARNNSVDPVAFFNHYESNGWMRGKTKIKDWKACVRTWENNQYSNKQIIKTKPRSFHDLFDDRPNENFINGECERSKADE